MKRGRWRSRITRGTGFSWAGSGPTLGTRLVRWQRRTVALLWCLWTTSLSPFAGSFRRAGPCRRWNITSSPRKMTRTCRRTARIRRRFKSGGILQVSFRTRRAWRETRLFFGQPLGAWRTRRVSSAAASGPGIANLSFASPLVKPPSPIWIPNGFPAWGAEWNGRVLPSAQPTRPTILPSIWWIWRAGPRGSSKTRRPAHGT